MKKKVLALIMDGLLIAGMVLGITACGDAEGSASGNNSSQSSSSGQEQDSIGNEQEKQAPLKISVLLSATNNNEETDEFKRMVQTINEYTNMDVEWVFDSSDQYTDAMILRMKAQNLKSVNQINSLDVNYIHACEEGAFWDITDYIDDYPNLAKIPELCVGMPV